MRSGGKAIAFPNDSVLHPGERSRICFRIQRPRSYRKYMTIARRIPPKKHVLLLVTAVLVCTLLSLFLTASHLKRLEWTVNDSSEEEPVDFPIKKHVPAKREQADQRIILIVPAIGSLVVSRPNVEPYKLGTTRRLLQSLAKARYTTKVSLEVLLTPESDDSAFEERYAAVQATDWNHGDMKVVNLTTPGLFEVILGAWLPLENSMEQVVIIDAAFARGVNVNWFENMRATRARYAHASDIAGFGASPISVHRRSRFFGMRSQWEPPSLGKDSSDNAYLYQGAAYIPILAPSSSGEWRSFQRWFIARRYEWFLWPNVVHPKNLWDSEWKQFTARGRAHWTMWYSRFLAEHGLYIMYPRKNNHQLLHGVKKEEDIGALLRLSFDGEVVQPNMEVGGATEEELSEIVQMAHRANGSVALTIVTDAFLETTQSWICNTDVGGFRPPATLWITPEESSYEALRKVKGSHAIHMRSIKGGRKNSGTSFNTPGYWLLMLERTRLIRDLLERGVGVFLFEPDQIWLRDPLPEINRLVESGDGVDLVGTLDSRNQIAGNFLYTAPTLTSRRLWREVTKRFSNSYHSANMHLRHTAEYKRYISNDQSLLTHLVFYDSGFRQKNPVVFRALDTDRFVDGRWYRGTTIYGKSAASPTMINNNFMVGIQKKKARAKKHGHWFWNDGKCDEAQVRQAIEANQMREKEAVEAAIVASGSKTNPGDDFDVGIDKAINGISKSLKYI